MKTLKNCLWIALLGAAVLAGCRDDDDEPCCDATNPECPNYDPCWDVIEPTAKILMRESYIRPGEGYVWTDFDNVFYNNVEFSSPHIGPEYEHTWYLGAEVIHDPVFTRTHPIDRPQFITVSHVITFPVDSSCYSNLTGKDSTSATYYIIEFWNEFLSYGKYRLAFANETDSFDMELTRIYPDGSPVGIPALHEQNPRMLAINFHNETDSMEIPMTGRNLERYFAGDGNVQPQGLLEIDPLSRRLVTVQYQYQNQSFNLSGRVLD